MPQRRYVSTTKRDATGAKKGAKWQNSSQRHTTSKTRGRRAAEHHVPRWANPEIGDTARHWTLGWELAHGVCEGCRLCLTGCEDVTRLTGDQYVKRWRQGMRGAMT